MYIFRDENILVDFEYAWRDVDNVEKVGRRREEFIEGTRVLIDVEER